MPGVTATRTVPFELPGAGAVVRTIVVKAGHVAGRHHHEYEQFLYVVSGDAMLACEAGPIPLVPGTCVRLERGAWHSAVFKDETVLLEVNLPA